MGEWTSERNEIDRDSEKYTKTIDTVSIHGTLCNELNWTDFTLYKSNKIATLAAPTPHGRRPPPPPPHTMVYYNKILSAVSNCVKSNWQIPQCNRTEEWLKRKRSARALHGKSHWMAGHIRDFTVQNGDHTRIRACRCVRHKRMLNAFAHSQINNQTRTIIVRALNYWLIYCRSEFDLWFQLNRNCLLS